MKRRRVTMISPVRAKDQRAARRTGHLIPLPFADQCFAAASERAQVVGSHPQLHARSLKRVEGTVPRNSVPPGSHSLIMTRPARSRPAETRFIKSNLLQQAAVSSPPAGFKSIFEPGCLEFIVKSDQRLR